MSMSDTREPAPAAALPTGVSTGATRLPSCSISFGSWLCANTNATNAATTRSIVDTQPSSRMSTMMAPALIRWSAVFHLDCAASGRQASGWGGVRGLSGGRHQVGVACAACQAAGIRLRWRARLVRPRVELSWQGSRELHGAGMGVGKWGLARQRSR
uniref:Uncharacterized protein n=1 Tax=Chlamydomonas euryale TaxID=1486919 RepID=A0A7R9V099_9CHLO